MSLLHRIEISDTPSYTDRETCVVNITVSQEKEQLPSYSIPSFSFSFDELDHFSRRCKDRFEEQLLRLQPVMNPSTRQFLVDTITKHAVHLAYERLKVIVNIGYVVEARLDIVHLRLADVEKGMYKGGDREELITCPVCFEDLTPGVEFCKLRCSHVFHTSCIDRWCETSKTCPYCRHKLEYENEELLADILS